MASVVLIRKSFLCKIFGIVLKTRKCSYSHKTMISQNEAVDFLQTKIHIKDVKNKLQTNRLELLREITNNYNRYVPFHNLTLLDTPAERRHLPDFEEIRKCGLKGEGGLSYPQALFSNWLLSALGYQSHLVACKMRNKSYPYTHIGTVAKDVAEDGDAYLVDVCAGFPTFEPVPLHKLPQKYQHAFMQYRFVQRGNEIFRQNRIRAQGILTYLMSAIDYTGWKTLYLFDKTSRTEEFVKPYLEKIYTQPGYGDEWYLLSLKMALYPKGKAVTLKNRTLKIWDEATGKVKITRLTGDEDLKKAVHLHFPMVKHIDLDTVLRNWQKEIVNWHLKKEEERRK